MTAFTDYAPVHITCLARLSVHVSVCATFVERLALGLTVLAAICSDYCAAACLAERNRVLKKQAVQEIAIFQQTVANF